MEEVTKTSETTKTSDEQQRPGWVWPLIIALILLLLLWAVAAYYNWGPFKDKTEATPSPSPSSQQNAPASHTPFPAVTSGSTGNTGATGAPGASSTTTPSTASSILNFSANVNTGDTKEQVSGQATGLTQNCTVASSTTAGKQEVCTYSDGSKIVTVTYLNDQVVNVSKSGF